MAVLGPHKKIFSESKKPECIVTRTTGRHGAKPPENSYRPRKPFATGFIQYALPTVPQVKAVPPQHVNLFWLTDGHHRRLNAGSNPAEPDIRSAVPMLRSSASRRRICHYFRNAVMPR